MKDIELKSPESIGPLIKTYRKEQKVTQEDLANFSGLSRIGIVKLEKGEGYIKLSTLIKVANLLGFEVILKKRGSK